MKTGSEEVAQHPEHKFSYKALTLDDVGSLDSQKSPFEQAANIADPITDTLADLAVSNSLYIVLRPVNPAAFGLMKNGSVGKSMYVHGKSAEKGPSMGLIPTKSSVSKAGSSGNVVNIAKFNQENEHSIEESKAALARIQDSTKQAFQRLSSSNPDREITSDLIAAEAKISQEDLRQIVLPVDLSDKSGNQIYIFENSQGLACQDGEKNHIYAIKLADGSFMRIDDNHEPIGLLDKEVLKDFAPTKLQVFGQADIKIQADGTIKVDGVKPITADIDVLAYGSQAKQSYDEIVNYQDVLRQHKLQTIEKSAIAFSPDELTALTTKPVDSLQTSFGDKGPGMHQLFEDLKKDEFLLSHMRGMGDGTDISNAITGYLREEFKDNIAISHGSEQFNLNFTQGLDAKWPVITPTGEKLIIQGEGQLMEIFNKAKAEGLSMPPNPNWGWKLNADGRFAIDPEYKKLFNGISDAASRVGPHSPASQIEQIEHLRQAKLELGKLLVSDVASKESLVTQKTDALKAEFAKYNRSMLPASQTLEPEKLASPEISAKIAAVSYSDALRKSFDEQGFNPRGSKTQSTEIEMLTIRSTNRNSISIKKRNSDIPAR